MKQKPPIPRLIAFGAGVLFLLIGALFFAPGRPLPQFPRLSSPEAKNMSGVIQAALPSILKLWEQGDLFAEDGKFNCPDEIFRDKAVGKSYLQCQPHFWQCFWSGGTKFGGVLPVQVGGETYHLRAKAAFPAISEYSEKPRFYQIIKGPLDGMNFHFGMLVEMVLDEEPDRSWPIILTDTCRDTYLPQRIYAYGKAIKGQEPGFLWDNFNRNIFIDRFYVSNQMVNEWRLLVGKTAGMVLDRAAWPKPALLKREEQIAYCSFWGKRLMEAKLFDAASMTPVDLKNNRPERVQRPETPWQRDLSKTFLGMARINPDYQLTPLDCQLAQVKGCPENFYSTDSVSWMGMNYTLGFYPEALVNSIDPTKNLKRSSRFDAPESEVHVLGQREQWGGEQLRDLPVAFRCYEEVSL